MLWKWQFSTYGKDIKVHSYEEMFRVVFPTEEEHIETRLAQTKCQSEKFQGKGVIASLPLYRVSDSDCNNTLTQLTKCKTPVF